jgi:Fe-S cluster assembly protein SufD
MNDANTWAQIFASRSTRAEQADWLTEHQAEAKKISESVGLPNKKHDAWRQTAWHTMPPCTHVGPLATEDTTPLSNYPKDAIYLSLTKATQQPVNGICLTQATHPHVHAAMHDLLMPSAHSASYKTTVDPLAARHQALCDDIWFLHLGPEAPEQPIVLRIPDAAQDHTYCPITLIVLAENRAPVTLLTHHLQQNQQATVHMMLHITLKDKAQLTHLSCCDQQAQAACLMQRKIIQSKHSLLNLHHHPIGKGFHVAHTEVQLHGEHSTAHWSTFAAPSGTQQVHQQVVMDHYGPTQYSSQYAHVVGRDQGFSCIDSLVRARKGSQSLNTEQTSHNLLLSKRAKLIARPNLAIDHEDVQCQHGATVGPLSDEALFYLKTRGINHDQALAMITEAFADTAIQRIEHPRLREWISVKTKQQNTRTPEEITETAL